MTTVYSTDPRTGARSMTPLHETTPGQTEAIASRAAEVSRVFGGSLP